MKTSSTKVVLQNQPPAIEEGEGTERERESTVLLTTVNPTPQIGAYEFRSFLQDFTLATVARSSPSLFDYRPLEQDRDVDSPLSSPSFPFISFNEEILENSLTFSKNSCTYFSPCNKKHD